MKEIICLVTGGFDPVHSGHIDYFKSAKKITDYLKTRISKIDKTDSLDTIPVVTE